MTESVDIVCPPRQACVAPSVLAVLRSRSAVLLLLLGF